MSDIPFNAKNGLVANGNFTANSTLITLGSNIQINTSAVVIGNNTSNLVITSNTLNINTPNNNLFVNYDQIASTNTALYIQNVGATFGLFLSSAGSNTTVLGNLLANQNLTVVGNTFFGNVSSNTINVNTVNSNTINVNYIQSYEGFFTTGFANITTQGSFLQWNRNLGDGSLWIINQRGGGAGGIGLYESSNNNVLTTTAYFTPTLSTIYGNLNINGAVTNTNALNSNSISSNTISSNTIVVSSNVIVSNNFNVTSNTLTMNSSSWTIRSSNITFLGTTLVVDNLLSVNTSTGVMSYGSNSGFNVQDATGAANGFASFYRAGGITYLYDSILQNNVLSYNTTGLVSIPILNTTTVANNDNSTNAATTAFINNLLSSLGTAFLSSPGYISVPVPGANVTLQWATGTSSSGSYTWTYPKAFNNAVWFATAIVVAGNSNAGNYYGASLSGAPTLSSATFLSRIVNTSVGNYNGTLYLFAIGL